MRCVLGLSVAAIALAVSTASAEQPPPPTPVQQVPACDSCTAKDKPTATLGKTKPAAAPVNPLTKMSDGFWGDWKTTQASAGFATMKAAVAGAQTPAQAEAAAPAGAPPAPKQKILDLAVTKPEQAAKLLSAAPAASDQAGSAALATVINMVAAPKTIEAAAPLVAPDAQPGAQAMTANLSTGIAGLPGIYLSDQQIESPRSYAPAGYAPVSGGSMGCPAGN